jgi:hypothetical protein
MGYASSVRIDLQLPLAVAQYYRVFAEPAVPNALRESVATHGFLRPLAVYTDGTHAVLRDGHHRLAVARELGLITVPVSISPNWLTRLYDEFTLPVIEPLLATWLEANPGFGHAEHVVSRAQANPRVIRASCSCGSTWRESAA